MTSPAITAQGTKLAYSDGGSPSSFTDIVGVRGIRGLGQGAAAVNDISDLDSSAKEKLLGLPDEGQLAVSMNVNHNQATHQAMRNARINRTRLEFRITFSNSKIAQFFGYVLTFGTDVETGDAVRGGMTVEIDGAVSYA